MKLTAVPTGWTRIAGTPGEPISFSVEGLPMGARAVISMVTGGS